MRNVEALEFKNSNGDTVTIIVDIASSFDVTPIQLNDVRVKLYRKKNYISIKRKTSDDYLYRSLPWNSKERRDYLLNKYLEYVTKEQIEEALINVWEKMRPTIDNVEFSYQ